MDEYMECEINITDFASHEIEYLDRECYRGYGVSFQEYARTANRLLRERGGRLHISEIKAYFWNYAVVELVTAGQLEVKVSCHYGVRFNPSLRGLRTIQEAYAMGIFSREIFAQQDAVDLLVLCRNSRFLS